MIFVNFNIGFYIFVLINNKIVCPKYRIFLRDLKVINLFHVNSKPSEISSA